MAQSVQRSNSARCLNSFSWRPVAAKDEDDGNRRRWLPKTRTHDAPEGRSTIRGDRNRTSVAPERTQRGRGRNLARIRESHARRLLPKSNLADARSTLSPRPQFALVRATAARVRRKVAAHNRRAARTTTAVDDGDKSCPSERKSHHYAAVYSLEIDATLRQRGGP